MINRKNFKKKKRKKGFLLSYPSSAGKDDVGIVRAATALPSDWETFGSVAAREIEEGFSR